MADIQQKTQLNNDNFVEFNFDDVDILIKDEAGEMKKLGNTKAKTGEQLVNIRNHSFPVKKPSVLLDSPETPVFLPEEEPELLLSAGEVKNLLKAEPAPTPKTELKPTVPVNLTKPVVVPEIKSQLIKSPGAPQAVAPAIVVPKIETFLVEPAPPLTPPARRGNEEVILPLLARQGKPTPVSSLPLLAGGVRGGKNSTKLNNYSNVPLELNNTTQTEKETKEIWPFAENNNKNNQNNLVDTSIDNQKTAQKILSYKDVLDLSLPNKTITPTKITAETKNNLFAGLKNFFSFGKKSVTVPEKAKEVDFGQLTKANREVVRFAYEPESEVKEQTQIATEHLVQTTGVKPVAVEESDIIYTEKDEQEIQQLTEHPVVQNYQIYKTRLLELTRESVKEISFLYNLKINLIEKLNSIIDRCLRDVCSIDETKKILQQLPAVGGLGFSPQQAESAMQIILAAHNKFHLLKPPAELVSHQPSKAAGFILAQETKKPTLAELEKILKPEIKIKSELETKVEFKPEVKFAPKLEIPQIVKPNIQVVSKVETKPVIKIAPNLELKVEVKPEVKLEAKTEIKPVINQTIAKDIVINPTSVIKSTDSKSKVVPIISSIQVENAPQLSAKVFDKKQLPIEIRKIIDQSTENNTILATVSAVKPEKIVAKKAIWQSWFGFLFKPKVLKPKVTSAKIEPLKVEKPVVVVPPKVELPKVIVEKTIIKDIPKVIKEKVAPVKLEPLKVEKLIVTIPPPVIVEKPVVAKPPIVETVMPKVLRAQVNDNSIQQKPQLKDIKVVHPHLVGPAEELAEMSLLDFRRLGPTAEEIIKKIKEKITVRAESFIQQIALITAWKKSQPNQLYLNLVQRSLAQGQTISQLIIQDHSDKKLTLTPDEFAWISRLNSQLTK